MGSMKADEFSIQAGCGDAGAPFFGNVISRRPLLSAASRSDPIGDDRYVKNIGLDGGGLFAALGLNFDKHVHQGNGSGGYAGDAAGVGDGAGADFGQRFLHFAGEAADGLVVEPVGDVALLGFLETLDGAGLLLEISGVFDFGFDGLELVAEGRRKSVVRRSSFVVGKTLAAGHRSSIVCKGVREELGSYCAKDRDQILDCDYWAF